MDRTLGLLPQQYRPEILLQQLLNTAEPVVIPGLGVILTVVVLLLTGVLAANFVGRAFVGGWESLLHRIPIVRSIYSGAKNFAEIVFSDTSDSFNSLSYSQIIVTWMKNKTVISITEQVLCQSKKRYRDDRQTDPTQQFFDVFDAAQPLQRNGEQQRVRDENCDTLAREDRSQTQPLPDAQSRWAVRGPQW